MKLPEDKSERLKVLVLIGLGTVFVLYATVVGVLHPVRKSKADSRATIDELTQELEAAQRKIELSNAGRGKNIDALTRILTLANESNCVLRARLGNYLLSAREAVERCAELAEVPIESVREIGISQLPQPSGKTRNQALNAYTVIVTVKCGTHDLIRLLEVIERSNPLLCVSGLSVSPQPKIPAAHGVTFDLQWPVWAEPEQPVGLQDALDRLRSQKRAGAGPPPVARDKRSSA